MTKANEKQRARLAEIEEAYGIEDDAVKRITRLLKRADVRRKQSPGDARRWNRTLDDLEDNLLEGKSRVNVLEHEISRLRSKLDLESPDDARERAKEPEAVENDTVEDDPEEMARDDAALAVELVLSTPIDSIDSLTLEDIALAKNELEDDHAVSLTDPSKRARLSQYIHAYESKKSGAKAGGVKRLGTDERRQQKILRRTLDKCLSEQVNACTFEEARMVVHCYETLLERGALAEEEGRLIELLQTAVNRLHKCCEAINRAHVRAQSKPH